MIRPTDFQIEINATAAGVCVLVTHLPTGQQRRADAVSAGAVGRVRDSLLAELRGVLFNEQDFRCDTGRAADGDFIRVVHLSTDCALWQGLLTLPPVRPKVSLTAIFRCVGDLRSVRV